MELIFSLNVYHIRRNIFLKWLSPRDIVNCLQVSKLWNQTLTMDFKLDKDDVQKEIWDHYLANSWLHGSIKVNMNDQKNSIIEILYITIGLIASVLYMGTLLQ